MNWESWKIWMDEQLVYGISCAICASISFEIRAWKLLWITFQRQSPQSSPPLRIPRGRETIMMRERSERGLNGIIGRRRRRRRYLRQESGSVPWMATLELMSSVSNRVAQLAKNDVYLEKINLNLVISSLGFGPSFGGWNQSKLLLKIIQLSCWTPCGETEFWPPPPPRR